jgi:RHS repeat-associated protein
LADPTGVVGTEYSYEPFGLATITGTPTANAFEYTGRENDGTGLYHYRARYYHPILQRFISEDPISSGGVVHTVCLLLARIGGAPMLHAYAYVDNDPLGWTDPLGLLKYKGGVPPATGSLKYILECTEGCVGRELTLTSTHERDRPFNREHKAGIAADIRYDPAIAGKVLCCAAECGAGFGLDEGKRPIKGRTTAANIHVQIPPGKLGGRGDLPKACRPGVYP